MDFGQFLRAAAGAIVDAVEAAQEREKTARPQGHPGGQKRPRKRADSPFGSGFPRRPEETLAREAEEACAIIAQGQSVLLQISDEAYAAKKGYGHVTLGDSERYGEIKNDPDELIIAIILAAFCLKDTREHPKGNYSYYFRNTPKKVGATLLRKTLPFTGAQLAALCEAWAQQRDLVRGDIPNKIMLKALVRYGESNEIGPRLRSKLEKLQDKLARPPLYGGSTTTKAHSEIGDTLTRLLDPDSAALPSLTPGDFGNMLGAWAADMPEAGQTAWSALFAHADAAADKGKPTSKWKKEASLLVKGVGGDHFAHSLAGWFKDAQPDPKRIDNSLGILKGLLWCVPIAGRTELSGAIGRFCEKCLKKVPGVGPRSIKLGNAALLALTEMGESDEARAELFRLRTAVRQPSIRTSIEKQLRAIAEAAGTDIASLEDAALFDYGLGSDGVVERQIGGAQARITLSATGVETRWTNDKGKQVKAPPASVKADHKAELDAFKQLAKDIDKARATQAKRIEASWLENRSWPFAEWRRHYRDHGLRRQLTQALIWQIGGDEDGVAVRPDGDTLRDLSGAERSFAEDAPVRLWHPLNANPDEVLTWRAAIMDAELTQPVKQAHREIYVLTDAERTTEIYSNRFAAHILRQHQFHALCKAKEWQFDYLGGWDNWNQPTRALNAHGIGVEFAVDAVDDGERSDSGVPIHLATDQVRFMRRGEQMRLEEIDPIVFSEVMRDVDLFVAVTSVANDPEWRDGGPEGRNRTYWHRVAFGELTQSAETRRELIAQIFPRLSIADKLEVAEKSLIVTGKRQQYAIHFGSTNIQILPANRYLCIVPDRGPAEVDKVRLPFTGDTQLSVILAKAFMLVDEDKITDATILRQL